MKPEVKNLLRFCALIIHNFCLQNLNPRVRFNEFDPRLKSAKNRFLLSAGLSLETLNSILSEINHI